MLPVSGAEQLHASGAIGDRPRISHSGAYSRLVSPAPRSLSGREEVPQSGGAGPILQLLHDGGRLPAVGRRRELLGVYRFVGVDDLVHEIEDAAAQCFGFA